MLIEKDTIIALVSLVACAAIVAVIAWGAVTRSYAQNVGQVPTATPTQVSELVDGSEKDAEEKDEIPADCEDPGYADDPACRGYVTIAERTATAEAELTATARDKTSTAIAIEVWTAIAARKTATAIHNANRTATAEANQTATAIHSANETATAVRKTATAIHNANLTATAVRKTATAIHNANLTATAVALTATAQAGTGPGPGPGPSPGPGPGPGPGPKPTPLPTPTPSVASFSATVTDGGGRSLQDRVRIAWQIFTADDLDINVVSVAGVTIADYQFRVVLNSGDTGFYLDNHGGACRPTLGNVATAWGAAGVAPTAIRVVRCGMDEQANDGFELEYRIASPQGPTRSVSVTGQLTQAAHWWGGRVGYLPHMDTLGGYLPDYLVGDDYIDPQVIEMEEQARTEGPAAADWAAEIWNDAVGGSREVMGRGTGVVIKGYWYNPNRGVDECKPAPRKPGDPYGCALPTGSYAPHISSMAVWIKYPPRGRNSRGVVTEWTNSVLKWSRNPTKFYYMPFVMLHELGHTFGLGHNFGDDNIMSEYYPTDEFPVVNPTAEDELGVEESTRPHAHGYDPQ